MRGAFVRLEALTKDAFLGVVLEATRSVVEGSELTGAPGQPVDTGALKASWQTTFDSPERATIGTNIDYAEAVEEGIGPHGPRVYGKKNNIGGSHSVALTVGGMGRIVDAVTRRAAGGGL